MNGPWYVHRYETHGRTADWYYRGEASVHGRDGRCGKKVLCVLPVKEAAIAPDRRVVYTLRCELRHQDASYDWIKGKLAEISAAPKVRGSRVKPTTFRMRNKVILYGIEKAQAGTDTVANIETEIRF